MRCCCRLVKQSCRRFRRCLAKNRSVHTLQLPTSCSLTLPLLQNNRPHQNIANSSKNQDGKAIARCAHTAKLLKSAVSKPSSSSKGYLSWLIWSQRRPQEWACLVGNIDNEDPAARVIFAHGVPHSSPEDGPLRAKGVFDRKRRECLLNSVSHGHINASTPNPTWNTPS